MSNPRVIDGVSGDPIDGTVTYNTTSGGNYGTSSYQYTTSQPVGYTTTTTTQPVGYTTTTNYVQGGGSTYVQGGSSHLQGGYTTSAVNSGYVASNVQGHEPQVVNTVVNTGKEVIKGESRIEYVPFEKKIVEYKDQARVERVPKKRTVTEYREEKVVEEVPREVTVTDYYAVEYLRQYIPQYVPEKQIEYVAKQRKVKKYEYIPVERQIVHYPQQPLEAEVAASNAAYQSSTVHHTGQVSGGQYAVSGGQYATSGGQYATSGGSYAVNNGGNYGQTTTYVNQVPAQTSYVQSSYVPAGETVTYTTGPVQTQGGYVSSGSGARYTGGETVTYTTTNQNVVGGSTYVTGNSGVRGGETVTYTNTTPVYTGGETVTYTTTNQAY